MDITIQMIGENIVATRLGLVAIVVPKMDLSFFFMVKGRESEGC